MSTLQQTYKENIIDHFKNPHNFGTLQEYTFKHRQVNPLCGDNIEISVKIDDQKVVDVKFSGKGCAISTAATSMLTDKLKGMSLDDIQKLKKDFEKGEGVLVDCAYDKFAKDHKYLNFICKHKKRKHVELTQKQQTWNKNHLTARSKIETQIDLLKKKFGILNLKLRRYKQALYENVIICTAIHNVII